MKKKNFSLGLVPFLLLLLLLGIDDLKVDVYFSSMINYIYLEIVRIFFQLLIIDILNNDRVD